MPHRDHIRFITLSRSSQHLIQRLGQTVEAELVRAAPIDVFGVVWAGGAQCLAINFMSLLFNARQCAAHVHNIVIDQQIRHQVVVFDYLTLLVT